MKFETKCPHCGKVFNLDQKHVGQNAKCICGEIFTVAQLSDKLPVYSSVQSEMEDISESNPSAIKIIVLASIVVLVVVIFIFKISFNKPKDTNQNSNITSQLNKGIKVTSSKSTQHQLEMQKIDQQQVITEQQRLAEKFPRIDLAWTKLPNNFSGHDVEEIYNAFSRKERELNLSKDQFETEVQFKNRVKTAFPSHLIGELSTDSLMAFTEVIPGWEYHYNPEQQEYNVNISFEKVCVKIESLDDREYLAQNAFGASVIVTNSRWREYVLKFDNHLPFLYIPITLKTPLEKAKAWNDKLALLYIVKPIMKYKDIYGGSYSFTSFEKNYQKPTFQLPVETETSCYNLNGEIVEVWAIQKETGEIFEKHAAVKLQQSQKNKETKAEVDEATKKITAEIDVVHREILEIENKKKELEREKKILKLLNMISSRFYYRRIYSSLSDVEISKIRLKIKNDTEYKINAIYFKIESKVLGQSDSIISKPIGFRIASGIYPAQEIDLELTPQNTFIPETQNHSFSDMRHGFPSGDNRMSSTFIITGIELENGRLIQDVDFLESDQKTLDDLVSQLRELDESLKKINNPA